MKEKDEKKVVLNRLVEFKDEIGVSWNALSASIGRRQTTISNQVLGQRALSLDTVIGTLTAYENLSAEWLLRGHGDMFLTTNDEEPEEAESKNDNRLEALVDTIALLQDTIKMKNATIDALQAELSQYKRKAKKA